MSIIIGNIIGTLDVEGDPVNPIQNITLTENVGHSTPTVPHCILLLVSVKTIGKIGHIPATNTWQVPSWVLTDPTTGTFVAPYTNTARYNRFDVGGSAYWRPFSGCAGHSVGTTGMSTPDDSGWNWYQFSSPSLRMSFMGGHLYYVFQSLGSGAELELDMTDIANDVTGGLKWIGAKIVRINGPIASTTSQSPIMATAFLNATGPISGAGGFFGIGLKGYGDPTAEGADYHDVFCSHAYKVTTGEATYSGGPITFTGSVTGSSPELWSFDHKVDDTGGGRHWHAGFTMHDYGASTVTETWSVGNITSPIGDTQGGAVNFTGFRAGSGFAYDEEPPPESEDPGVNLDRVSFRAYR